MGPESPFRIDPDRAVPVGQHVVGGGERRKRAGQTLAVRLVAGEAQAHVDLLALFELDFLGQAGDVDFLAGVDDGFSGPVTLSMPRAPLLKARVSEWSTRM
jgi:hypothetical protein